jgi:hypothetical protein
VNESLGELRRRALAELNLYVRRLPSGGYAARRPGGGRGELIARNAAELRTVLTGWLAR